MFLRHTFAVVTTCVLMAVATSASAELTLTSNDLKEGGRIADVHVYKGFGCSGGNVSPQLAWDGAPAGTKSFALTVYDPDAPTGSGWWHWVVVNLPPSIQELPRGSGSESGRLPQGAVQTRTDFGTAGYGGPCPPPGTPHRYVFTIHALKVDKLDLDAQASGAMAGFMINSNSLGKASLTAMYGR